MEKSIKAFFWHSCKKEPPYTHNLLLLAEKSELNLQEQEAFTALINALMPLNIQGRYPEDKTLLLRTLNKKRCEKMYLQTVELNKWIRKLLK